jgi:hypothetical protein
LHIFSLGSDANRNVRVGVFPEREEGLAIFATPLILFLVQKIQVSVTAGTLIHHRGKVS